MINPVYSLSSSLLVTLFRLFIFAAKYKILVPSAINTTLRSCDTQPI